MVPVVAAAAVVVAAAVEDVPVAAVLAVEGDAVQ